VGMNIGQGSPRALASYSPLITVLALGASVRSGVSVYK